MKYNKFACVLTIIVLFGFFGTEVCAQQSLGFWGGSAEQEFGNFRLNSFEMNPTNFSNTNDWEISTVYGTEFAANTTSSNLYMFSISKKMGSHYLYARYSPGLQMEFNFNSGTNIVFGDSVEILNSNIKYKEKFGLGYSYNIGRAINFGITLRYFTEELTEDKLTPVFSDTLNYFTTESQLSSNKFLRGDFGISFSPLKNLIINVASYNLLLIENKQITDAEADFEMDKSKGAIFGFDYMPVKYFGITVRYETSTSFTAGLNTGFNLLDNEIQLSASIFHDEKQIPFIAAVMPSLNISRANFSLSFSWLNYLSGRDVERSLNQFENNRISNIFNNQYSHNKLLLSANISLSFIPEKQIEFLDVKITKQIFPTMAEKYINESFAIGRVLNISDKPVTVKPYSSISDVNDERIESPSVVIAPKDTADIRFFTILSKGKKHITKRIISDANFYVTTNASDAEVKIQKPILINDLNSWDGKVSTLKYFLDNDFQFSADFAKSILSAHKIEIEKSGLSLKNFIKTKILFNKFAKLMVYVADPRSSVEYVQFPNETLKIKGGDCDDLSVAFGSLLESIGIQTAFVDYRAKDGVSHVNLIVNTNIKAGQYSLITNNDKKYFVRKNINGEDEIWIPIETTSLTDFDKAWSVAAEKFQKEAIDNLGLAKGNVQIVDIY